jgi:hypothetical protein
MRSEIRLLGRLGGAGFSFVLALWATGAGADVTQSPPGLTEISFQLHVKGGAAIDFKYRLSGASDLTANWPQAVNGVLNEQLHRLQQLLNDRTP